MIDEYLKDIVPTFAISTHYLLPIPEQGETEWDVVNKHTKFNSITDVFELMVETLIEVGYEEDEVLEQMFSFSSVNAEGQMREEMIELLKEIDGENNNEKNEVPE